MRLREKVKSAGLVVSVALALAACGSAKHAPASSSSASTPAATSSNTPPRVTVASYTASLSGAPLAGAPAGAPNGAGAVSIRIRPITVVIDEVCWTFSHLVGVAQASEARIGVTGTAEGVGMKLGVSYREKSCVPGTASTIGLLEQHPHDFIVSIDTKRYPEGAVRGRL